MRTYKEICVEVGYDKTKPLPEMVYRWYSLKNGETHVFDTHEAARKVSSLVERVATQESKDAYKEASNARRILEIEAIALFEKELREEYSYLSDSLYDLCYDAATNHPNAYSYDDIANLMDDIVEFATKVRNLCTPGY